MTICDHVYFQPPTNTKLSYPCIIFKRKIKETVPADDIPYLRNQKYEILVIEKNYDIPIAEEVSSLPMCRHTGSYESENLYHNVYSLTY